MVINHLLLTKVFNGLIMNSMKQIINLSMLVNDIREDIDSRLRKLGLFYRIFARGKTESSISHKMSTKSGIYNDQKKNAGYSGSANCVVLY